MKTRIIGIIILLVVIVTGGGYYFYQNQAAVVSLNGYLGGEKIGLFEDEEVKDIIKKKYHVELKYARAGSLDMVTADQTGRNYLFPSSQTALEYYEDTYGKPLAEEIIFNTPIVLYTHKIVTDALVKEGVVTQKNDVYYADMQKLTDLILSGAAWGDIGLTQLYGSISVDVTDPARSNSGNMFAALLANVLNGGKTVGNGEIDDILPELKEIFGKLGYMETSSSDLFNQFLRMGVGAKPIIAGYESQLFEYVSEKPEAYEKIKDDIVIMYPSPTVWSTHIYIALDEEGKKGIQALSDEEVQQLAWEKHGFRTDSYDISNYREKGNIQGVPEQLSSVINMPEYTVMKKIIETLQ